MATPDATKLPQFSASTVEPGLATRAWRFLNVAWLAACVYVGYKAIQLWTRFISKRNRDELFRRQDLRAARAMYTTAVRLEGLLIKASQFIATRADILPDEWVSTLAGLHDRVPPRPFAVIRHQIELELQRPLDSVFAEFNEIPIASASLAQVHEARLHDGRRCAVKVQYPNIEGIVRADLRNLMFVLKVLAWVERDFDFQVVAREVMKYIPMELDFEHEGENARIVRKNFAASDDVVVPEIYGEFTTRRVLTMELVSGIKISDVAALERAGIDKRAVAQKLIDRFCDMILRDGFFHADPHPGNILVQPGPKLVFLDFGLAKDFPVKVREGMVRLTFAILVSDRDAILQAFRDLGFRTRTDSPQSLLALADAFLGQSLRRNKAYADQQLVDQFSEELPRQLRANPIVEVPGDVLLVNRVMGLLSGLGKTLDSDVNLFATLMPYAQRLMPSPGAAPAA